MAPLLSMGAATRSMSVAVVLFALGCAVPARKEQYAAPQEPLPVVASSEPVQIPVMMPVVTPQQEKQRQEKGAVVLIVEPVAYSSKAQRTPSNRTLVRREWKEGGSVYDVYSVKSSPVHAVSPEVLQFKVRVISNHERILKLEGAVVSFVIDGKSVSVPKSGYEEFMAGILTPHAEKEFTLTGPKLSDIPESAIIGVTIYDVVTQMNNAGVVGAKENFEWYFNYKRERKLMPDFVSYAHEKVKWRETSCNQCGGSGKVMVCETCKGKGQNWVGKCTFCNGTGQGRSPMNCGVCNAMGKTFTPPE